MEHSSAHITHRNRLIGLNIGLFGLLALMSLGPGATEGNAQPGAGAGGARGRGEYTMVSGRVNGATTNAVWVLDAANQELVALSWDRAKDRLDPIGYRNLSDDAKFLKRPR